MKYLDLATSDADWIEIALKKYIDSLMEIRYNYEKTATKHELTQFDL